MKKIHLKQLRYLIREKEAGGKQYPSRAQLEILLLFSILLFQGNRKW